MLREENHWLSHANCSRNEVHRRIDLSAPHDPSEVSDLHQSFSSKSASRRRFRFPCIHPHPQLLPQPGRELVRGFPVLPRYLGRQVDGKQGAGLRRDVLCYVREQASEYRRIRNAEYVLQRFKLLRGIDEGSTCQEQKVRGDLCQSIKSLAALGILVLRKMRLVGNEKPGLDTYYLMKRSVKSDHETI